ncbi:MAG: DUF2029 domain-containing protein [Deltaproteobacteria bacterium]|nr:DUF2029 domain-containing protein [Deltaproteobacteria bacterium]
MTARRDGALFALSLALQACMVGGVALTARSGGSSSTAVVGLALCFVPYAGALVFSRAASSKRAVDRIALASALLFGALLLFAPPLLSDDLYRYLWEGRLWLEGLNPYRLAPDDPAVAHLRDGLWANINNKPLTSIYPPLSQLIFVVAQWLGGEVWTLKLLALLAHALSVALVARACTERKASLAIALNPLLLSEAALNGHFDILCGVLLLVAAWALSRQRFAQAGVAACAAVGLKVVGLVVIPLFVRRPRVLIAAGFGSALLLVPLVWPRALVDPASGAGQFATRWRGNESTFALVDRLSYALFDPSLAQLVARCIVAAVLLGLCALIVYRRVPPWTAIRALVWAVLLLSPQVHPWYLAWLLPLEVAAGGSAGLVWSAAILCAYAPLDRWVVEGVWDLPLWVQILEYAVVGLALILDPRRPTLARPAPEGQFTL